jgi:peroxiredoxin
VKNFHPRTKQFLKGKARSRMSLAFGLGLLVIVTACSSFGAVQIKEEALQGASGAIIAAGQPVQEFSKQVVTVNDVEAIRARAGQVNPGSGVAQDSPGDDLPGAVIEVASPPAVAPSSSAPPPPPVPAIDLSIPAEPRIGARAPDFAMQNLDGNTIRLSDFLGRPFLLNFWATWCIPCQQELTILQRLHQEYQPRGFVVVSINAIDQDALDKVQSTSAQYGMTYPILLDQGSQFSSTYHAIFFPTTFFVDANGVIRQIFLGDGTEEEFRLEIEKLLAGNF